VDLKLIAWYRRPTHTANKILTCNPYCRNTQKKEAQNSQPGHKGQWETELNNKVYKLLIRQHSQLSI
jgi:hypothetical protein